MAALLLGLLPMPAARAKPARGPRRVEKLEAKIDAQLLRYFQLQVRASRYRGRLLLVQGAWADLFSGPLAAKNKTYPPPPAAGLRIDDAVVSSASTLDGALRSRGCKTRSTCRLWVRLSFSKALLAKRRRYSITFAAQHQRTRRRRTLAPRTGQPKGNVEIISLSLVSTALRAGAYTGTLLARMGTRTARYGLAFSLGAH